MADKSPSFPAVIRTDRRITIPYHYFPKTLTEGMTVQVTIEVLEDGVSKN